MFRWIPVPRLNAPYSDMETVSEDLEYVGFWPRVAASIIDGVLIGLVTWPVGTAVYGMDYWTSGSVMLGAWDFLLSWVVPAIAVITFWIFRQSTPGKMAVSARIVDARTGGAAKAGQYVGRYLSYFVAAIPLFVGIFWIAFDRRKQGWHDKMAGTVVVRQRRAGREPVSFSNG